MSYDKDENSRPQDQPWGASDPGQGGSSGEPVPPAPPAPQGPGPADEAGTTQGRVLPESTHAVPAFVLGLVGTLLAFPGCLCYGFPAVIGMGLGIAAWVMAAKERRRVEAGEIAPHGLLTPGFVLGIVATVLAILMLIVGVVLIAIIGFAEASKSGPSFGQ